MHIIFLIICHLCSSSVHLDIILDVIVINCCVYITLSSAIYLVSLQSSIFNHVICTNPLAKSTDKLNHSTLDLFTKRNEGINLSACTGSIFSKINTYLEVSQQVDCFHFACIEVSSNLIHLHAQPSQIDSTLQDA